LKTSRSKGREPTDYRFRPVKDGPRSRNR
jgi:hypothetical protein